MKSIDDKSIDMILCDLPYGTTECKWDIIIPFDQLWKQYERIIKDNGVIVLFGVQPFTSKLVLSNENLFKYSLVWEKTKASDFANCKNKFVNKHEDIVIFSKATFGNGSKNKMKYNPQGIIPYGKLVKKTNGGDNDHHRPGRTQKTTEYIREFTNYPGTILKFASEQAKYHPTQKPVALFEYLIKTYTNEGDLVLDNCIGSGTTAIAALNTNRDFIGIEKELKYVQIANTRIQNLLREG